MRNYPNITRLQNSNKNNTQTNRKKNIIENITENQFWLKKNRGTSKEILCFRPRGSQPGCHGII